MDFSFLLCSSKCVITLEGGGEESGDTGVSPTHQKRPSSPRNGPNQEVISPWNDAGPRLKQLASRLSAPERRFPTRFRTHSRIWKHLRRWACSSSTLVREGGGWYRLFHPGTGRTTDWISLVLLLIHHGSDSKSKTRKKSAASAVCHPLTSRRCYC